MLHRTWLLSIVAVALASTPACSKKKEEGSTSSKDDKASGKKGKKGGGGGDDDEDEASGSDKPKAKATEGCKAPKDHHVRADWTVPEGCKLEIKQNVELDDGVTLTVGAGATLSFAANTQLWVSHGKIVAKGTDDKPVRFTSANSTPAAGDWQGIIFGDKTMSGNVLDHVIVEYAGHSGGGSHGAITVHDFIEADRISITNSTIAHNSQAGVFNDKPKARFKKLEGNTFKENGVSLELYPDLLGSVGDNKLGDPVHLRGGNVTKSQKWPKLGVPIVFEGDVEISGAGSSAVLTLADDTTLKFKQGHYLWIGSGDGGGIVGKGTVFTSANATPASGDWQGLIFAEKAGSTNLTDCVIEYAGSGGSAHAAVTFTGVPAKKLKGVKLSGCKFRHNEHGAFWSSDHDCAGLEEGNKSEGTPLCVKD